MFLKIKLFIIDLFRFFRSLNSNIKHNQTILRCYDLLNDLENDYGYYLEKDGLKTDSCYDELLRLKSKLERDLNVKT